MENNNVRFEGPLQHLPPVDFCCAYGSALLPSNRHETPRMVDYILGVPDPVQWHSELMIKYGVVRIHDLMEDLLCWKSFYLSGRLQKPVRVLVDDSDIVNINSANLKAAISTALLLLPPEFTEEDLYSKICSLSYMGDLRMIFAEDRNKVKKIVHGSFDSFRSMYKPFLHEYAAKELLKISSSGGDQAFIKQDCSLYASRSLVSALPQRIRTQMGITLQGKGILNDAGHLMSEVHITSREEAAKCIQMSLRRLVMVSSARQAVSGVLAAGGMNACLYLANKMSKARKSGK